MFLGEHYKRLWKMKRKETELFDLQIIWIGSFYRLNHKYRNLNRMFATISTLSLTLKYLDAWVTFKNAWMPLHQLNKPSGIHFKEQ